MTTQDISYIYDDFEKKISLPQKQYEGWKESVLDYIGMTQDHSMGHSEKSLTPCLETIGGFMAQNPDIKKILNLVSTNDDEKLKTSLRQITFARLLTLAKRGKQSNRDIGDAMMNILSQFHPLKISEL